MDSYEDILERMLEKYRQYSGFVPSEQSDIMIRLKVLAGEVYNIALATQFLRKQMFVSSASNEYLDKHALQRGIQRKEAQKATGELTFSVLQAAPSDIVIEKGCVVSTTGADVKQFVTDETVTLKAGTTNVKVGATAVLGGSDYNVLSHSITVMVTPPTGINSVRNDRDFKGGVDRETDSELRQRVISSYQDISNSTNAIYYKRLAQSIPGVYSASVISQNRGAGTIDVYICGKGNAKVNNTHIEKVQALLDENRELNVDVLVLYAKELKVRFTLAIEVEDGYSFDELKAQLQEKMTEHIDLLGVGKPALLSDLGDIVYHTTGVKNYYFLDAFCGDVIPRENEYCVAEEFDIRQV